MADPRLSSAPPPPSDASGCLTALMIVAGLIMLLPGICSLIAIGADTNEILKDSDLLLLALLFLAIGAGGVALIWWAIRRQR
jgi:drug/metabolite transporter (DMT)-like permease